MNIILTGATGTLGSRILYELLRQESIRSLYLLIREKKGETAKSRLKKILTSHAAPKSISDNSDFFLGKIRTFNTDDFFKPASFLPKNERNFFIHSAGFVNLSTHASQKESIYEENLEFTKRIFDTFSSYLHKFTYISTAYCIGNIGGLINNDYHVQDDDPDYRNFYEGSKHAAEKFLLRKEKEKGLPVQILRPSVLGGNVMEAPKYFISKHMVYYLVGKFFYKNPLNKEGMRMVANKGTGLNIIPVDYAAKIIAKVFTKEIKQLNIVHSKSTDLVNGFIKIMEAVGFENFTFVNATNDNFILEGKNKLEEFYYNSIGVHLNPYLTSKPYEFDTRILESILPIPAYNLNDYLANTVEYAKLKKFRNERW